MLRVSLPCVFVFGVILIGLLCFDHASSSAQDSAVKEATAKDVTTKSAAAKDVAMKEVAMKEVFADKFAGKLAEGWTWFHEDAEGWKVDGEGLQLRTLPGTIWSKTQFNQLERVAPACPEGKAQAVEVTVNHSPQTEYEQAGLQVMVDDKNIATLCTELYKQKFSVVSGRRIEGKFSHGGDAAIESNTPVTLRITKKGPSVKLEWLAGNEWKTLNEYPYPAPGELKVGIHAHGGKKGEERWARFQNFRILQED
jgi:regulation of enolase protein 1 (concanavalin A-like superfamily)